ncbi:AP-3 complex subunit beta, partial [Basidiobolus ranarum]
MNTIIYSNDLGNKVRITCPQRNIKFGMENTMAEYLSKAAAFAQSAAKISKKVSEGIVENAREFGFDSSAHFFDTSEVKLREIHKSLDSGNDREKMDGLKRLIAMISKGRDVSEFFPDVVKNVAST